MIKATVNKQTNKRKTKQNKATKKTEQNKQTKSEKRSFTQCNHYQNVVLPLVSGTDLTTAITTFSMIGKFAISYAWAVVVVYTPEVFPTGVR